MTRETPTRQGFGDLLTSFHFFSFFVSAGAEIRQVLRAALDEEMDALVSPALDKENNFAMTKSVL